MKIKKEYTFTNGRQIWRLLLAGENLIIEDRDPDKKEAFFNCIEVDSGVPLFKNLIVDDEKFWIGISAAYKNFILFHKYNSPDMPEHREIIAFDVNSQKVIWRNDQFKFSFVYEDKVYVYKELFEGKTFCSLSILNGELLEEFGEDYNLMYILQNKSLDENYPIDCKFPEQFNDFVPIQNNIVSGLLKDIQNTFEIAGNIEYIIHDDFLLFNYYFKNKEGYCTNIFKGYNIGLNKQIFEEVLNENAANYVPDAFFTKKNKIFLLKEKNKLIVYSMAG